MMSSTALPKVMFIRAPIVSPSSLATLSVAWLSSPARGMMAIAFIAKTIVLFTPAACTAMPTGTNPKRRLIQLENKISLQAPQKRMNMFGFSSLSSGFMEADVAPSPASSGGGAGGGKLDEVLSATLLLVELEVIVISLEGTPATGESVAMPALLKAFVLSKGTAERRSSALDEMYEACALRAEYLIRPNKLGSSEDSTIWVK